MRHSILFALSLLTLQTFYQVNAEPDQPFTVYCTGNHDATGNCLKTGNSEDGKKLECIMVPGNIIDCESDSDSNIECILITATSAQAEFSCNRRKAKSLTSVETTSNQNPDYQEDIIYDDETKDSENEPNDPQPDVFTNPF